MATTTDTLPISNGDDIVRVRQKVRVRATEIGLSLVDQTKLITAASELARNALDYGRGGQADIETIGDPKRGVRIVHGEIELTEKLGRNDLCPCGSGLRFQGVLPEIRPL